MQREKCHYHHQWLEIGRAPQPPASLGRLRGISGDATSNVAPNGHSPYAGMASRALSLSVAERYE